MKHFPEVVPTNSTIKYFLFKTTECFSPDGGSRVNFTSKSAPVLRARWGEWFLIRKMYGSLSTNDRCMPNKTAGGFAQTLVGALELSRNRSNRTFDFNRSYHFLIYRKRLIRNNLRFKLRDSYQKIFNIDIKLTHFFITEDKYARSRHFYRSVIDLWLEIIVIFVFNGNFN